MKKIYISADVEGLNGVSSFTQVLPECKNDYAQMQPQLHLEMNALIKGLKKAGVEEIIVNDAHNTMTNLTISMLPADIKLISGKPKKVSMMYGLDSSFDGVILFAYHAKATSAGALAHTFNMYFKSVWLNGEKISEAQLNGIYAAIVGVPIVLASGDNVFCDEIKADIGDIATIQTKEVISPTAIICEKNEVLLGNYEHVASKINDYEKVYCKTSNSYELKVELKNPDIAKIISQNTKLDWQENFIFFNSDDYVEIYTTLQKISAETTAIYAH